MKDLVEILRNLNGAKQGGNKTALKNSQVYPRQLGLSGVGIQKSSLAQSQAQPRESNPYMKREES